MSGTNWKPTLVARVRAGRATDSVASVMIDASKRGLMILAGESDVFDKINLQARPIRYYSNKVFGIYLAQLDLFSFGRLEIGDAHSDQPNLPTVFFELSE